MEPIILKEVEFLRIALLTERVQRVTAENQLRVLQAQQRRQDVLDAAAKAHGFDVDGTYTLDERRHALIPVQPPPMPRRRRVRRATAPAIPEPGKPK